MKTPKSGKYNQGYYTPKNPQKYKGDINKIRFMSSYELSFFTFLDNNPSVLFWGSEIIAIPYIKPTTGRIHKYYPDVWVKYKNRDGDIIQEVAEIKPYKQTIKPTTRGKSKKTQLYEALAWSVNKNKWLAAQCFCDKYGLKWRLVTEKDIFR